MGSFDFTATERALFRQFGTALMAVLLVVLGSADVVAAMPFVYDEPADIAHGPDFDPAAIDTRGSSDRSSVASDSGRSGHIYDLSSAFVAPSSAPTYNDLRRTGQTDAHHIIQDAAVRDVPGYSRGEAPAIQLDGPSTQVGSPHYNATQVQRQAGGGTYGAERQIAACSLAAAGCSPTQIADALARSDSYFIDGLGLTLDSPLRIPGNRPR
jgi:hypothetical protein